MCSDEDAQGEGGGLKRLGFLRRFCSNVCCACVSTSELTFAVGSEADRAHLDDYVAVPLAATAAPGCLVPLRFGTHVGHCDGLW